MNFGYECHLTFDPSHADFIKKFGIDIGWKTSQIYGDPLLGDKVYFYLTCHEEGHDGIRSKMWSTIYRCKDAGIPVIRTKIEQIIFDEMNPNHP